MTNQTNQPADRKLTHRTRQNTAAIRGLSAAVEAHCFEIRLALTTGNETKLQESLADLMMDCRCIESAIVEQEQ